MAGQGVGEFYCAHHRDITTNLRCGRCDTPVCPRCRVHGPVGIRCLDCGRPPQLPQYQVSTLQLLRAMGASLGMGIFGGFILLFLPLYGIFYLIVTAGFGLIVAEMTSYAANSKRGPKIAIIAVVGTIVGHVLMVVFWGTVSLFLLLGAILAAVIAYVRLK